MRNLLSLILLCCSCLVSATTVTYKADNTTDFCNPERGFYNATEQKVKETGSTNTPASTLVNLRKRGISLLYKQYYLNNFQKAALPENVLNIMKTDFQMMRDNGCKMVVRFSYTSSTSTPYQDSSPEWWAKHLDQLKPLLNEYADVIACVQAGFLGVWGEWYYSSLGVGERIPQETKTDLINKLLECVPASRAIQLRTPAFKKEYLGHNKPLTAEQAFNGSAQARLAHHNDAFLSGSDNMGTYNSRTADMNYIGQDCLYLPNGGETNDSEDEFPTYTTSAKAKEEMGKLHYSFLNESYCSVVLNKWKKDGSYNEIARNLGYRFQLVESTFPETAAQGKHMAVVIKLVNVGYAALYNERPAYLVFTSGANTYKVKLNSDPRFWAPNGAETTIKEAIVLPENMVDGTYKVFLYLPDAYETIANDSRFAIRFANEGVWDDNTGYNDLNIKVTVNANGEETLDVEDIISSSDNAKKIVVNGQIMIQKSGITYNLLGAQIR